MRARVLRSEIIRAGIQDFAAAAVSHAAEMKAWRDQERRVEEDRKNDVSLESRHVSYPKPRSHPLVELAIDENDAAVFDIVEDGPSTEEILAAKKLELLAAVTTAEMRAKHSIVPPGKQRLFNRRAAELTLRALETKSPTIVQKLMGKSSGPSAEDQKFMDEHEARLSAIDTIDEIAAQAMHDIEDLTAENIDQWQMPEALRR